MSEKLHPGRYLVKRNDFIKSIHRNRRHKVSKIIGNTKSLEVLFYIPGFWIACNSLKELHEAHAHYRERINTPYGVLYYGTTLKGLTEYYIVSN